MHPKLVSLREITADAAPLIVKWRNDPANARWFPKQEPWTVSGHCAWYRDVYLTDPSQNLYLVCRNDVPVGTVGMSIRKGSGEVERVMLGDKSLAHGGIMREGLRQLMGAYGLERYWLRVMPDNEIAIRFYEGLGFLHSLIEGNEYANVHGETGHYLVLRNNRRCLHDEHRRPD